MTKRVRQAERYDFRVGAIVLWAALSLTTPITLADPASVRIGTAALISTTQSTLNSAFPTSNDSTHTNSIGTSGRPAEIVELARALRNDPDLIYDFVRNYVDTVWMYGLQKGAVGAIVDKTGTPFDQAHLMVELLREAGHSSAAYQVGRITLNATQFQEWTGITSATAACQLLSSGGIPAGINGTTSIADCTTLTGSVTSVILAHVWVSVTLPGGTYVFDPSYKPYTLKTGVNLTSATGLSTGAPMTASGTGMTNGTQSGVPWRTNLGMEQLYDLTEGYADNLLSYINTNLPAGDVEDLVGGRDIVRFELSQGPLRQTSLPYTATVFRTWAAEIPDQFRTSLRVQVTKGHCTSGLYPQIIDHTFYADDIYARRVVLGGSYLVDGSKTTVTLTVNNEAGVGTTVYSGDFSCNLGFNVGDLTLTADHPYPAAADGMPNTTEDYMDVTTTTNVRYSTPLVIVHGWGDSGRGLIEKLGTRLDGTLIPIITAGCETCALGPLGSKGDGRREQLAASWLAQSSTAARLHAEIANSIYQHHHSIGVIEGESEVRGFPYQNPNPLGQFRYTVIDSFDRFNIETGFSLTNKGAGVNVRRAAVHAIAATIDSLEGSVAAQTADLPDTSSTATRFEWGNNPPASEDPAPGSGTPRRFYEFSSVASANVLPLVKVELQTTTANDGIHDGSTAEIGSTELNLRRTRYRDAISSYVDAVGDWEVFASEEAFLGPGQRAGAFVEESNGVSWHHRYSKQRSGALIAIKYDGSEPVEIAHVTVGADSSSKGGGGGAQPTHQATYDPSQAADILKSRFVDRSKVLGVDLLTGSVGASSPASLSVGNGGFPYELSASLIWSGGNQQSPWFGPVSHTEPQAPWTTNWNNTLTVSGSGMEMMDGDIRALAGTVAAFLAQQDVYKSPRSIQREVTGALVAAWWARQLTGNVVTANVGADSRQFVQPITYYNEPNNYTYILPGASAHATLTRTGWRSKYEDTSCIGGEPSYVTSRGWNYASVSFNVTNANGDVQSFPYWIANYQDASHCAKLKGFRLSNWTFPQGITVNLVYVHAGTQGSVPELTEVNNSLGRKITFINSGRGGFNNGLTSGNLRSVTVTGNPADPGIITHTDPGGAVTKFNVAIIGQKYLLTQIFNALNGTTPSLQYDYDSLRRVKEAKDAVSLQVGTRGPHQFFIGEGARSERTDPAGGVFKVVYDERKRPLSIIDEIGRTTTVDHDGRGRVIEYVYPELDRERLEYDVRNNVTKLTKMPKGCSTLPCTPAALVVEAGWHATWNKPTFIIDARGNQTDFTYVPVGTNGTSLLQQALRPVPEAGKPRPAYNYTYNARGQRLDFTDPTGLVTRNAYFGTSPFNLQTTTLEPGGLNAITTFAYDAIGDTTSVTDPRNNVTETAYDNNRRNTVVKHHDGGIAAALLAAERTTYDLLGQVTKEEGGTVFSGTNITTWQTISETTYTKTGQVETAKNGAGNTTTTFYDAADRVDIVQDPQQRKVKTFYDAAGQVLCTWRGWTGIFPGYSGASSGQPCRWDAPASYPGFGPVRYAEFTYTANGQRATVKDAGNNLSQMEYNVFDQLENLRFPNGTAGSGTASTTDFESYNYDANGNRTSLTKRDRTTTIGYTYDTLNRLTVKDIPGGTANDVYSEYDAAGRPLWSKFVSDAGSGVVYGYGPGKRLTSEASFSRTVTFDYDLAGNRTKVIWPSDGNWIYSNFDNLNRVTKVCENGASGCPSGLLITYTLDPLSRRDAIARPNSTSSDFDYDLASRLTLLSQNVAGTTNDLSRTFTYNPAGQLATRVNGTAAHWLAASPGTSAYVANGRNQYTSVAGATHTHDLNGNLTGDGSRTFGYDAENRLTSVSGSASLTLTYDPLGRLRQTTAGAATTDFLYEGDRLLAEYNGATVLRRYAHGPGVDEPIVWYEGSGLTAKRWLHPDERGSIVAFSDGAGAATVYRYGEPRRVSRRLITDGVIDTRSWRYATEFPGATARRVVTRQRQGVRSRRRSARAPRYFASFLAAFQGPKLMVRIFVTTK